MRGCLVETEEWCIGGVHLCGASAGVVLSVLRSLLPMSRSPVRSIWVTRPARSQSLLLRHLAAALLARVLLPMISVRSWQAEASLPFCRAIAALVVELRTATAYRLLLLALDFGR